MGNYHTYDDVQLLDLLRADDNAAFLELYERYHALLLVYASGKLQEQASAEDVVQEVFISLWENRRDFQLKTYLSGFLYKSVLNKILNIWKHNKVVREHAETYKLKVDVDSYQTDYLIREKEIRAMIEEQISSMPPRMRRVYELKHREFRSTREIAEEMGISENTVSNQLKNASAHLKKNLGLLIYIIYLLDKH